MPDRSIRSGTALAREIQLTDRLTTGNPSNRSSGGQIPCHICTRFGRYLCSTKCSCKIIEHINKRSQQTRIHFSFYACQVAYLHCTLYRFDINIQRHSVSVRSTCLLDTLYKLNLHREVGSGLIMEIHFIWLLELKANVIAAARR